jgi:hypothetical protein
MPRNVVLAAFLLLLTTISPASGATSSVATKRHGFRHAYYLFLSGTPAGCEDCYVPLLITTESLEETASQTTKSDCALITTYERDSISHNEGLVSVASTDIAPHESFVFGAGGIVTRKSALRKHSEFCRIPAVPSPSRRPGLPPGPPGPSIEGLILELRDVN